MIFAWGDIMAFELIPIEDYERWDNVVRSFSNYDVFYLSGYSKSLKIHGDGEPLLFYIEHNNTRGINVVIKRDISLDPIFKDKLPKGQYFDFSSPYGYGGFLIEGTETKEIMNKYDEYCLNDGIVSEFVRFHLFNKAETYYNGSVIKKYDNIVRNLDISIEDIQKDFEYKVRKNLNRANQSGLYLEIDQTGQNLNDFLKIYYETMEKNNAKEYYYFKEDFFKQVHRMKGNFVYFYVFDKNGNRIATELVLYSKDYCYSFLGGTNPEYFSLRPNDFLKFEIIKWAKEEKIKYFVLGGGYGPNDGIFRYKKSLAPHGIYSFYIGKKIINQNKYNYLVEMKKKLEIVEARTDFFPEYRS